MPTQEKIDAVAEIKRQIEQNEIAIATKYIGINVAKSNELRKQLRGANISYKVYKNTLAKRALDELGFGEAAKFMEGPTAWAFSKDPVAPAKLLKEFAATVKFVSMSGGVLGNQVVTAAQLEALASLPGREQLLAQVVGTIAAPLRKLVGTLEALPRNLVSVLDQVRKKKEEEAGAAA